MPEFDRDFTSEPSITRFPAKTAPAAAPKPASGACARAPRSAFASDSPVAAEAYAPPPTCAVRLARFVDLAGAAPTPFALGLLAPAGGGKTSALGWIEARAQKQGGLVVARFEAAELAAEPERALAAGLFRALAPTQSALVAVAAREAEERFRDVARAGQARRVAQEADRRAAGARRPSGASRRPARDRALRHAGHAGRQFRPAHARPFRGAHANVRPHRRSLADLQGFDPRPRRPRRDEGAGPGLLALALRLQGPDVAAGLRRAALRPGAGAGLGVAAQGRLARLAVANPRRRRADRRLPARPARAAGRPPQLSPLGSPFSASASIFGAPMPFPRRCCGRRKSSTRMWRRGRPRATRR